MCISGLLRVSSPRYWNLKRAAGYYNWVRRRRSAYRRDVLDRIVADMQQQQPDHIVVTGDLANIGLPQEHINALAWLQALGPPERVSVVPGNHDIYSRIGRDPGTRRWAPYMTSDAQGADFVAAQRNFPFVRVLGQVALVGVNSGSADAAAHGLGAHRTGAACRCCPGSRGPWSCQSVPRRAHPPSAAAWPGFACTRFAGRSGTGSCPGPPWRRAGHPRAQSHQHAGMGHRAVQTVPGRRRAVRITGPKAPARTIGPLQPVSYRPPRRAVSPRRTRACRTRRTVVELERRMLVPTEPA